MDAIDLTTAAGIAALVMVLIQIIKPVYRKYMVEKWAKFFVIVTVLLLCIIISVLVFLSDMIENDTVISMLYRAGQAAFIAIGGYEGIKQLIKLFTNDKSHIEKG